MNTKTKMLCAVIFSMLLLSCSKAHDLVNAYVNSLSASVNGSAFKATDTNAQKNDNGGTTQLTIDGSGNGARIIVAINGYNGQPGTFEITSGSQAICAVNTGGSSDLIATSGEVVITKIDNSQFTNGPVVTGTFHFTAQDVTVTDGTFSVFVAN